MIPLSFAQQRLWFLDQLTPGNPSHNVSSAYRIEGLLDVHAMERSLSEIVARHETLRTRFVAVGGHPYQVIDPPTAVKLVVEDVRHVPDSFAVAHRLVEEEEFRTFDLSRDPLLRARLIRLGDEEYVISLTMHHISSDGWSWLVFRDELHDLYGSFVAGEPSPLAPLAIQYADFAVWQRSWLTGELLEVQLDYWRGALCGALPVLDLPTDHVRPPVPSYVAETIAFELPLEVVVKLRDIGRTQGTTLFMTLLAAFSVLMARYSGQSDVAVGSPIAGRTRPELEGLIGFFVNTLVLRTDCSGNLTFNELLTQVREVALGAYSHQDLPFERLVEDLDPVRDLSRNPLVQVMFQLMQAQHTGKELAPGSSRGLMTLPGLKVVGFGSGMRTVRFDLSMFLVEKSDGLSGYLSYATDLFEADTVQRMLEHFRLILNQVAEFPDFRLSELSLLSEAERHHVLVEWNDTQQPLAESATVVALFEAQVLRTPRAVAVVCDDKSLTYGELNERSNQLAHLLQSLGARPDAPVGLALERGLELIVGLLGILKAGGAYLPLDPEHPRERLAFVLDDSACPIIVTQSKLLDRLSKGAQVVRVDSDRNEIANQPTENPSSTTSADNLAYVIYTSGSTGRPKGVEIQHRGVVNLLSAFRHLWTPETSGTFLAATPLSFDIAGFELFFPWLAGMAVLLSSAKATDGEKIRQLVETSGVAFLQGTPANWRLLLDVGWEGGPVTALCAGETCPPDLASDLFERTSSFWNLYGPTETTIYSCAAQLTGPSVDRVPIGRPIANTQVYILDTHGELVPVGVPGELYIGGVGLARGYMRRPGLTAERFVPNRFGPPGSRLYRTGDVTRYRRDGSLEFLGRKDDQVKLRGFRIELGEIEAMLIEHPDVHQCAVVVREESVDDRRLVAYVVYEESLAGVARPPRAYGPDYRADGTEQVQKSRSVTRDNASELRAYLKGRLPSYMVPSAFVPLDRLPLTPNGKLNRQRLPAPPTGRSDAVAPSASPRSPTEVVLARIWGEVLGVDEVGVEDDFFDIGGHSLLAPMIIGRANEAGINISLLDLFERPTISSLLWNLK